ncbi:hypothetical protein quinque_008685 [Culex quinquefasciatus]
MVVSSISPWENAVLIAVDEADIPRKEVLRGYFYRSKNDENDTILGYLESQNDNLDTSAWRILRRSGKNDHVEWAFTVDTASMQLLEEQKFVVNYKFGQTMFRRKQADTGSHPADDDSDEDMEVDHFDEGLSSEALDIDAIQEWCNLNGMKVNLSKCKSISFTRSPAPIRYDYTFARHEMDRVCSIRDLGLLIDRKLSFSEHVSSTTAKAFALLGFLRRNTAEFENINALKTLYITMIRSILDKCKSISFTRSPAPIRYDYTFDRHEMDRVCSIRDLGLLIDRKLSFSEHVSSTTAKAFALLGFLRRNTAEFENINALKTLYITTIRSILESSRTVASTIDCVALQQDIDAIQEWCNLNGMKVNPSKCKSISFTRSPAPIRYDYTFDRHRNGPRLLNQGSRSADRPQAELLGACLFHNS